MRTAQTVKSQCFRKRIPFFLCMSPWRRQTPRQQSKSVPGEKREKRKLEKKRNPIRFASLTERWGLQRKSKPKKYSLLAALRNELCTGNAPNFATNTLKERVMSYNWYPEDSKGNAFVCGMPARFFGKLSENKQTEIWQTRMASNDKQKDEEGALHQGALNAQFLGYRSIGFQHTLYVTKGPNIGADQIEKYMRAYGCFGNDSDRHGCVRHGRFGWK